MADTERRYTPAPVQIRTAGDSRKVGGYAAVFNRPSRNLGGFVEVVTPAFFNRSRSEGWPDVICRYNHDDNMLLGTTGGNTLTVWVDETGLGYDVDPPQARADVVELVARGDIRKSSFAFRVHKEGDDWALSPDQGYPMRSLLSGTLIDVAPVNSPAYDDTTVGMRQRGELDAALRSLASKMDADPEDVRKLASDNELTKFFVRTDDRGATQPKRRKPPKLGASALVELMARREDPYV